MCECASTQSSLTAAQPVDCSEGNVFLVEYNGSCISEIVEYLCLMASLSPPPPTQSHSLSAFHQLALSLHAAVVGMLDKAHERREREEEEEEEDLVYCVEGGTGALNCIQFCYAQYLTCSNLSLPLISPSLSPSLPLYPSPSPLFLSLSPLLSAHLPPSFPPSSFSLCLLSPEFNMLVVACLKHALACISHHIPLQQQQHPGRR